MLLRTKDDWLNSRVYLYNKNEREKQIKEQHQAMVNVKKLLEKGKDLQETERKMKEEE